MDPSALQCQLKAPCHSVMTAKAGQGHQGGSRIPSMRLRRGQAKICQGGFGTLILPSVLGGYYIISRGHFQPIFLMLNMKPCDLPPKCGNKWDLSSSLSGC